jgi:hypothetical protein
MEIIYLQYWNTNRCQTYLQHHREDPCHQTVLFEQAKNLSDQYYLHCEEPSLQPLPYLSSPALYPGVSQIRNNRCHYNGCLDQFGR